MQVSDLEVGKVYKEVAETGRQRLLKFVKTDGSDYYFVWFHNNNYYRECEWSEEEVEYGFSEIKQEPRFFAAFEQKRWITRDEWEIANPTIELRDEHLEIEDLKHEVKCLKIDNKILESYIEILTEEQKKSGFYQYLKSKLIGE